MTPEQKQQIKEIFESVLDRPPDDREHLLSRLCASDAVVRAEVEELLRAHREADGFLAGSPLSELAGLALQSNTALPFDCAGRRIGVYELRREIGHGGMATVYLAERMDGEYRQQVALKLVSPHAGSEEIARRFKRERQILASLDHPNIARLIDGGSTVEGWPYLVMEYIAGQPITRYCAEHKLPLADRLRLFQTVCAAVAYAHRNLIVHRDIKPGNILVTEDGVVKLLDFGIAKLLSPELGEQKTITGLRPLTPNYASPEQLREDTITTATDVYSLGVLLYEMLTGGHPHDLKDRPLHEVIHLVCEEDPLLPSSRNPQLRGDLDNIVLLALRKDPRQRYQTVEQFSEDINRFLAGEPVSARPATLFYRTGKFARRNKTSVAVAATVLILLMAGLFFTLQQNRQQRYRLYAADMSQAGQAWEEGNLAQMDALLEAHRPGTSSDEWRGFEWFALWKLLHPEKFTLRHQAPVPTVVYSQNGNALLTGDTRFIEKWDAQNGQSLGRFANYTPGIFQLHFFNARNQLIVNSGPSLQLSIWDYPNQHKLVELALPSADQQQTLFFALSPDETTLVTSIYGQPFRMWETTSGKLLNTFTIPASFEVPPGPPIFSPDGRPLCLVRKDKHFELWDLLARRSAIQLDPQSDDPRTLLPFNPVGHLFSPDGKRYYLPTEDFRIRVWDFKSGGKPIQVLAGHEDHIETPALSHDGNLLASGSDDRTLRLWDTRTGKLLVTVKNESQTFSPTFSPDDKSLAAVSMRALRTKVWDVQSLLSFPHTMEGVQTLGLSQDGKLITVIEGTGLGLRDLRSGQSILIFANTNLSFLYSYAYDSARVSADGKLIATLKNFQQGDPGFVVIWETATGKVITELDGHSGPVSAIAISSDSKMVATGGNKDKLIKLWDAATGREKLTLRSDISGIITCLDFSPDGSKLASGGHDTMVRVWDVVGGKELFAIRDHTSWIMKVRFSPDGKLLASADMNFNIKLWDATTGRVVRTLNGHANSVYALAFSPDGMRLASGSDDKTVRLWDVQTGTEMAALRGHTGEVWHLFFTPDGKTLISSGEDGTRIWQTATEEEVRAHSKP